MAAHEMIVAGEGGAGGAQPDTSGLPLEGAFDATCLY
jgi:hypothetical protein